MARVFQTRKQHRQRTGRRKRAFVMNRNELAEHFGVEPAAVEAALERRQLRWHTDSTGDIYASVPESMATTSDTAPEPPAP